MQVPQLRSEEALVLELLDKDDVLVHPGYFFDFAREAFLIVSLLVEPALFDQGVAAGAGARGGGRLVRRRQSGISVPLFSIASSTGWGIGEFADLPMFARWLQEAGQSLVQILPINEMPPIETSPYSAMTAMALDPIYITMADVPDFAGLGGELALDGAELAEIATPAAVAAASSTPRSGGSRSAGCAAPSIVFSRSKSRAGSPRATRFDAFAAAQSWWLDEYALFRSLHAMHDERAWTDWPEPLARADAAGAARRARSRSRSEITYRSYLQWIAAEQWAEAKRLSWPVRVFGDLPFMISADSPDVWARQNEFRFDATIGVPPDAFSETGQDWGLPPWRADVMARMDSPGCDRAPAATAPCTTASASITSSGSIARTFGRSTSRTTRSSSPPTSRRSSRWARR